MYVTRLVFIVENAIWFCWLDELWETIGSGLQFVVGRLLLYLYQRRLGWDDHRSYHVHWSLHHHLSRPHTTRDTSQSSQPIQGYPPLLSSPLWSLLFIRIGEQPSSPHTVFFYKRVRPPVPFKVWLLYLVLSKFNNKLLHQKLSSTEFHKPAEVCNSEIAKKW